MCCFICKVLVWETKTQNMMLSRRWKLPMLKLRLERGIINLAWPVTCSHGSGLHKVVLFTNSGSFVIFFFTRIMNKDYQCHKILTKGKEHNLSIKGVEKLKQWWWRVRASQRDVWWFISSPNILSSSYEHTIDPSYWCASKRKQVDLTSLPTGNLKRTCVMYLYLNLSVIGGVERDKSSKVGEGVAVTLKTLGPSISPKSAGKYPPWN